MVWASQLALALKNPPASGGDTWESDLTPGLGRAPWRRAWPLTPVLLPGDPTARGARGATFHRVSQSQTCLRQLGTHAFCDLRLHITRLDTFPAFHWVTCTALVSAQGQEHKELCSRCRAQSIRSCPEGQKSWAILWRNVCRIRYMKSLWQVLVGKSQHPHLGFWSKTKLTKAENYTLLKK